MPVETDLIIERGGNVTIVAANLSLLDIAERGDELAAAIGALPPVAWPPEHNDASMFAWVRRLIEQYPGETGYNTWFIVGGGMLCGTAGFKGPPGDDGSVEIGYSVIPEAQRRGFASEAVELLAARAFRDQRVTAIRAETLLDGVASQAVLRRCGFGQTGLRHDPEDGDVVCFELSRAH
ncbi:GNAT family N-acetyltransferase [Devosia sp. SL43]|uniref:GNAT family N-acetyltransferase n=1 Tax=Devosia sp. SL43 TaxID=2806348 RepID=UPI001F22EF43|nr:GNAT family N-acetyltransferase [Devosia sp. SL43]UJW86187.1 GNAT family N-acetyltransferase [Devosia sp. SL43]